jgi:serine/threonine protein kinase
VTAEYSEVYELPPGHVRFNEFIGKYGKAFSDMDRLNVVKLLIAKFSDLHEMKIAHRDIADHSLWISPSKEVAFRTLFRHTTGQPERSAITVSFYP